MQTSPNSINLIRTKTDVSPQFTLIETSLRRVSILALGVFLLVGILTGSLYFYYSSQLKTLDSARENYRKQIRTAKNIEGLLTAIKDRTRIVERAMSSQRPLGETLKLLSTVTVPPQLSSVSIDEQSTIEITLQGNTITDILPPVTTLILYANQGRVRNPELRSVQFAKNGLVTVSLIFSAVF